MIHLQNFEQFRTMSLTADIIKLVWFIIFCELQYVVPDFIVHKLPVQVVAEFLSFEAVLKYTAVLVSYDLQF